MPTFCTGFEPKLLWRWRCRRPRPNRTQDLGSKELNLLATGPSADSASVADQPFFYPARLAAAQSASDARVKIRLLSNALADTPADDDARIPLFQAAASIRSDELARAVLEPLLRQQFLNPPPAVVVSEDEVAGAEDQAEADAAAGQVDTPSALPTAQRAQVAWTLSEVLVRLDRLNEAIPYMRLAYQLEKAPARRKLINSKITERWRAVTSSTAQCSPPADSA